MESWWKSFLAVWSVLLLIAVIVVGGWKAGWWLNQSVVNHRAHIVRSSYEFQTTLRNEMYAKITDVRDLDAQIAGTPADNQAALRAQRTADVNQVCSLNLQIQGNLPDPLATFVHQECP